MSSFAGLRRRTPGAAKSLVVAVAVALLTFPEVVLLGGSLSSTGMNDLIGPTEAPETVEVYPSVEDRGPRGGLRDIGTRIWQLEAATKFMSNTLDEGDTPYWNPFSAAGSFGPETLADLKLSPFVLSIALLGGSSTAFTVVLLLFLLGALYCIGQFFTRTIGATRLASIAACVAFLLNGWATSMFTSMTSAPYILFPIVLYAACEYQRRGGPLRFLAAVAAYIALLTTTFVPSVLLVLLVVQPIALLLDLDRPLARRFETSRVRRALARVGRQAFAPLAALVVAAYVWFPILDALNQAGDDVTGYAERLLPTKDPILWLTVLTPRHAFRSFDADAFPGHIGAEWTVYLGLVPLILVAAAWPRAAGLARRLLAVSTGLIVAGLVFHLGLPGLKLVALTPLLRPMSSAYWASMAGMGVVVALGVAVDVAAQRGLSARAAAGTGAAFAVALLVGAVGFESHPTSQLLSIAAALFVISAIVALVAIGPRILRRPSWLALAAVALMTVELLSYQNHERIERYDLEDHLPAYVAMLQENLGAQRILSIGRSAITAEWGSVLELRQITTFNLMQQPWYREFFFRWVSPRRVAPRFLEIGEHDGRFASAPAALDVLSVRYLVVDVRLEQMETEIAAEYPLVFDDQDAGVRVYENPDAYPRAFLAATLSPTPRATFLPPWSQHVATTDDARLLQDAVRAGVPTDPTTFAGASDLRFEGDRATIVEESNGRVRVDVEATDPSVLVLGDTFHRNWTVQVDHVDQHIGRVDGFARGVVVPAGPSTVTFIYRSPARALGAIVSLAALAALAVGCLAWGLHRRRSSAATPPVHAPRLTPPPESPRPLSIDEPAMAE
jgi:hypothetical protein